MPKQTRRRGVKASRLKLMEGLRKSGLKSQAELAERIANREQLETVPRDSVNRAFREQRVDMITLQRIAEALDLEVQTLLMAEPWPLTTPPGTGKSETLPKAKVQTADVEQEASDNEGCPQTPQAVEADRNVIAGTGTHSFSSLSLWAGVVAAMVIIIGVGTDIVSKQLATRPFAKVRPALDRSTMIIDLDPSLPVEWEEILRGALARDFNFSVHRHRNVTTAHRQQRLGKGLDADLILTISVERVGNQAAVVALIRNNEKQLPIFTDTTSTVRLENSATFAQAIADAARFHLGFTNRVPRVVEGEALTAYLQGRSALEESDELRSYQRARSKFEAAVELDPGFGSAYAGLCETLALMSWHGDAGAALADADRACLKAEALQGEAGYLASAKVQYLRMSGQHEQALHTARTYLREHVDDAYLYLAAALVYQELHGQKPDRGYLATAIDYAERAEALDATLWRAPYNLGGMYFQSSRIADAIDSYRRALAVQPNESTYVNLGTMQLCQDDLTAAMDSFEAVADLNPETYLSDEFMGSAYYFAGDYDKSLSFRILALEKLGNAMDIHQSWGSLGDSYAQTGDALNAAQAYRHAISIIRTDRQRDVAAAQDKIFEMYYSIRLAQADSDAVQPALGANEITSLANAISSSPGAAKLAQVAALTGRAGLAMEYARKATETCPVHWRLPELQSLAVKR